MKRRRWLLILGGTLLLGATVVLSLAFRQPSAPFRFLEGQEPIATESGKAFYTFQAEFDHIAHVATEECIAQGLRTEKLDFGLFKAWRLLPPGSTDDPTVLYILANTKGSTGTSEATHRPGWVQVEVYPTAKVGTIWDRVKAVFGL